MSRTSLPVRRLLANAILPRRPARLERLRVRLSAGAGTTMQVACYDRAVFTPRVVVLDQPAPLARWCREQGVRHAVVGGFFLRPDYVPLGEVRIAGVPQPSVPFAAPWGDVRACLHVDGDELRIARRNALGPHLSGDLLQAGPLLVRDGRRAASDGDDTEGFSAASHQFDSDITLGRYPRAAFALTSERLLAVACDGRTHEDSGLTLAELADALIELGATDALNLDGGGSASLVYDGHMRNRPREQHGVDLLEGRAVVTAVVFDAA
jgi:hypothetical protein